MTTLDVKILLLTFLANICYYNSMSDLITIKKGHTMTNTKQTIDFVGYQSMKTKVKKKEKLIESQGINYGFYVTTKENDKLTYLNTTFLDDLVEFSKQNMM